MVVPAAAVEAQVPLLAELAVEAQLLDLAQVQVPPHKVVEARLLDLALVVEARLLLLSRQSFSAAMARSTP